VYSNASGKSRLLEPMLQELEDEMEKLKPLLSKSTFPVDLHGRVCTARQFKHDLISIHSCPNQKIPINSTKQRRINRQNGRLRLNAQNQSGRLSKFGQIRAGDSSIKSSFSIVSLCFDCFV
jgi:hypothetical protein